MWSYNLPLIIICSPLYYYYFTLLRVFHTSLSWWFPSGVWVTASLLKPPGLFPVFRPILIQQWIWWFRLVLLFSNPLVLVRIIWWLYHVRRLQLVSPSFSCSVVFKVLLHGQGTDHSFLFQPERQIPLFGRFSLFLLTITKSSRLAEIRWAVCILKSKRILCISFSRTDFLYTMCSYGQI